MYIYFNEEGKVTTVLPHGSHVRQGNNLEFNVAMYNGFDPTNKVVSVLYRRPGDKYFSPTGLLLELKENKKTAFNKLPSEQNTFDLKDGEEYYTYYINLTPANSSITAIAGKVEVVIRIEETNGEVGNQAEIREVINQGICEIFIERTLGYSIETEFFRNPSQQSISIDQYTQLVASLANINNELICMSEQDVRDMWDEVINS